VQAASPKLGNKNSACDSIPVINKMRELKRATLGPLPLLS
jgi:hypothetical protein